jgi:peptide-methionine (S)-S-oxide reductase
MSVATFAAGCFWGVESAFRAVDGVTATAVGYIGGASDQPTYEDVCSGRTGHAEAVEVQFDRDRVTYEHLLDVFFACHDPTTLNRQGPDVGTQYRSAVYYHDADQQAAAADAKQKLEATGRLNGSIVTEITSAPAFFRAEEYHQQYLEKRGQGSCRLG